MPLLVSSPSRCIASLANLIELLNSRRNGFFAPIAYALMWGSQVAYALEAWRARPGQRIGTWLQVVAESEALVSLAAYAYENPNDPFPEVFEGPATFEGAGLACRVVVAHADDQGLVVEPLAE